jgi:3-oxoacyl-[acyl-carrier-protein] synthase-1
MRAGITNPTQSRYKTSTDQWLQVHAVPLDEPIRGRLKLARMAAHTILECSAQQEINWPQVPVLLCVAERSRPGRVEGLEEELFAQIQAELGVTFSAASLIIPHGRASVGAALLHARKLIFDAGAPRVLIVGTDSLLGAPTLSSYERARRLLTTENSDGFIPGEAAACVLVGPARGGPELLCTGIGFATEHAHIESEQPLRAQGLTKALADALQEADRDIHSFKLRIADISGEQYYFKEAALAVGRLVRRRTETFELWHPAEFIGEVGAACGISLLIVVEFARRKGYLPTPEVIVHAAADAGPRVAVILDARGG